MRRLPIEGNTLKMLNRVLNLTAAVLLIANLAACQKEAESESAVLTKARTAMRNRDFEEALGLVRGLVEANPDDGRIQRIYGEALIAAGQPSLSVWPLSRAMKDPEQTLAAGVLLAGAQLQGGSGQDAIETASRVIAVSPDDHRAYLLRARAYLSQNLEEETIADLDRALERGLEDDSVEFVRLYALFGLGRIAEGEELLFELHEKAVAEIDSNPKRAAEMCGATAQYAYESGDFALAEERFDACLDGDGLRNSTLVGRAIRFFDERRLFKRGTEIARRRFESNSRDLGARVAYAERLAGSGRFDEAEALLLEATEIQAAAWSALVDFYMDREDFREALDALEKSIEANPYAPDSWFLSRADFLIILGELDEAEESLEDIKLEVHRAIIEGRLLLARRNLEPAAKRFEEALVLWPDNPDLRYLTANAYEHLGDWAKAASHLREAARHDPPHYLSSVALADIMKGIGDREGRLFVLLRLSDANPRDADVLEDLLDIARESGADELVKTSFTRLSLMPGEQGRAIANVARAGFEGGDAAKALETIDTAGVDLSLPPFFAGLRARCHYLVQLDRRDEAIAQLDEILAAPVAHPHASALHALRGELRLGAGSIDAAAMDFDSARTLDPESLEAALGLAAVAEARGEQDRVPAFFEEAADIEQQKKRQHSEASIAHARYELRAGAEPAAKGRLRAVLDRQPRNGEAALLLAQLLRDDSRETTPSAELLDTARRALLFEQGPGAAELTSLFPKDE